LHFLPSYISNYKTVSSQSIYSLSFDHQTENEIITTYTPIQLACELGYIIILKISYEFFKNANFTPIELDINYSDPVTGENCALIACKLKNYAMIKFLHSVCEANFHRKNARDENALQIACSGSKRHKESDLLHLCKYLIEEVHVDARYNYEETLILCEDPATLDYLKSHLLIYGIGSYKSEPISANSESLS
jgi:hypothetical protein